MNSPPRSRNCEKENRALRQRHDTLATERASLLNKNETVRGRVEAMIGRLKTLEPRRVSAAEPTRVTVRILEKEYVVACPHEERAALLDAAEFLTGRMREIRDSGKVVGLDRIAVMAALNLANELLRIRTEESNATVALTRVRAVRERAETALARSRQLEIVTPCPALAYRQHRGKIPWRRLRCSISCRVTSRP